MSDERSRRRSAAATVLRKVAEGLRKRFLHGLRGRPIFVKKAVSRCPLLFLFYFYFIFSPSIVKYVIIVIINLYSIPGDDRPYRRILQSRCWGHRSASRTHGRRGWRSRTHANRGEVPPRTASTMTPTPTKDWYELNGAKWCRLRPPNPVPNTDRGWWGKYSRNSVYRVSVMEVLA